MPVVFVHGVNTRKDRPGFREEIATRDAFIQRLLMSREGGKPFTGTVRNPYWGDDGAGFAWNHASVPHGEFVSLGLLDDELGSIGIDPEMGGVAPDRVLLRTAKQHGLAAALDLLAVAVPRDALGLELDKLVDFVSAAGPYAEAHTNLPWLDEVDDDEAFVDRWVRELQQPSATDAGTGFVALGIGRTAWADGLKEGVARVRGAFPNLVSRGATGLLRRKLHTVLATFVGDVVVYFSERGAPDALGAIPAFLSQELEQAFRTRTSEDDKLVVIGHSLGGVILYDLLTSFIPRAIGDGAVPPEFRVDVLVTVGSQVGLFEEMKQFRSSEPRYSEETGRRVPKPHLVERWINVFDPVDILSFEAESVFQGVEDFKYSSNAGIIASHGAYFSRPSFYRRLKRRLEVES